MHDWVLSGITGNWADCAHCPWLAVRRKTLTTNPLCLVDVSGETKAMGVNADRKSGVEPLRRSYVNYWYLPAAPAAKLVPSVVLCTPLDQTSEAERGSCRLGNPGPLCISPHRDCTTRNAAVYGL